MAAHTTPQELRLQGSRPWMAWLALVIFVFLINGPEAVLARPPSTKLIHPNSLGFQTTCSRPPASAPLRPAQPATPKPAEIQAAITSTRFTAIDVDYLPAGTSSLSGGICQSFPNELRPAFEAGLRMWEQVLYSDIPVTITACYSDLGPTWPAASTSIIADYRDFPGAPLPGTCYAAAEANALAKYDLNGSLPEAQITLNSRYAYYTGSDGSFDSGTFDYDLSTVMGHEAGHALGFIGSMDVIPQSGDLSERMGQWGINDYPTIFDRFVVNSQGQSLLNSNLFANASAALRDALTSNAVFFDGRAVRRANRGQPIQIYAPSPFQPGYSYQHLDAGNNPTPNLLMIPHPDGSQWVVHAPGIQEIAMMYDIGWPAPPILTPGLTAPTGVGISLLPAFSWNDVPLAQYYELQLSRSADFTSLDARVQPTLAAYSVPSPLLPNTTYYWRVRAWRYAQAGEFSSLASFTTTQAPNAAPITSSIGPDHIVAGSGAFTLNVYGSSFARDSKVRWDGQPLTTTFINSHHLSASIPGSLIGGAKNASITVFSPEPGGGVSAERIFTVDALPVSGDCLYVRDFSVSPDSPSNAQDISIHINIRTDFPNFRSARLSVIGRETLGSFSVYEYTRTWNTRAAPDGDYTLLLEIDDTNGTLWENPSRCTRSYHLEPRPVQPPATPVLSSIDPGSVNASEAGMKLHVYGANFQPNSAIVWNGNPVETDYAGPDELTAHLPSGWVVEPDDFSISVATPGADASNNLVFHVLQSTAIQPSLPINGDIRPLGTSVTFQWQSNGAPLYHLEIWKDGTPFFTSAEIDDTAVTLNSLSEGDYTWQVSTTSPAASSGLVWSFSIRNPNPPAPALISLSRSYAIAGSPAFTLQVSGSGFTAASRIRWNEYELPTTYLDAGHLQAEIPAGYLMFPGSFNLTIFTPPPGGGTSSALAFVVIPPVDRDPPALTWIKPVPPGQTDYSPDATLRILASSSDSSGIKRVDLYRWDTLNKGYIPISSPTVAPFFGQLDSSSLNPGWNQVFAKAYDIYDNAATVYFWIYSSGIIPAPQIIDLSPNSLPANGGTDSTGSWIWIYGGNFAADAIVWMDGVELTTNFQNNGSLMAWAPAELLHSAGQRTIKVSNPGLGGQESNTNTLMVTTTGECRPAYTLSTGSADTFSNNGPGSTDQIDGYTGSLWVEKAAEYTYRYTPETSGKITIKLTPMKPLADLDLFLIDGANGDCSANHVLAFHNDTLTYTVEAWHPYYVVVDGFVDILSAYTIRIDSLQPAPVLSEINPGAISANAPLINLYGSDFRPNSVVIVGGVPFETYFITETQLMARMPANLPLAPGQYDLVVFNPQPGGGYSQALKLQIDLSKFLIWIPMTMNE